MGEMNMAAQVVDEEYEEELNDRLGDALMACLTTQAEAYAKACWLGLEDDARTLAEEAQMDTEAARYGYELVQKERAEAQPCEDSAEQLSIDISWRPGDETLVEEFGMENEGYCVKLQLLLLGRCSYTEADVIVPYMQRYTLGQEVQMEAIDAATALSEVANGGEFNYLLRQGNAFWTDDLQRPDALYNPQTRRVRLDQVHQIWRMTPVTKG